jgi:hypothetical protein
MTSARSVGGSQGLPFMKFTLIYDGELPSTGNGSHKAKVKWGIRKAFEPQLEQLWASHAELGHIKKLGVWLPKTGTFGIQQYHHDDPADGVEDETDHDGRPMRGREDQWNLAAPIEVGGKKFLPLIRRSFALTCSLNITFLRQEDPGSLVLQGGDLDNRIKTLFDALRMPDDPAPIKDPTMPEVFHCLLESDALITGLNVSTDRLLVANKPANFARLVVQVNVGISRSGLYNLPFMGD